MAKYRQKVEGVVVTSDGEILLVKAPDSEFWMLPGGGVKLGESFMMAAQRELKEECGVKICNILFLEELDRINDYGKLSSKYRQTFAKGGYLGAEVTLFSAKVDCEDLSNLECATVYKTESVERALHIFASQAKKQTEELFRWIEVQRIEHIQHVFF